MNKAEIRAGWNQGGGIAFCRSLFTRGEHFPVNLYGADVSAVEGLRRYVSAWLHYSNPYQAWLNAGGGGLRERQVAAVTAHVGEFSSAGAGEPGVLVTEAKASGDDFVNALVKLVEGADFKIGDHDPKVLVALILKFHGDAKLQQIVQVLKSQVVDSYGDESPMSREKYLEIVVAEVLNYMPSGVDDGVIKSDVSGVVAVIKGSVDTAVQGFIESGEVNQSSGALLSAMRAELYFEPMMIVFESLYYMTYGINFALSGVGFIPMSLSIAFILHTIGPAMKAMQAAWKEVVVAERSWNDVGLAAWSAAKQANSERFGDINTFHPYIQTLVDTYSLLGLWYVLDILHKEYQLPFLVGSQVLTATLDVIIMMSMNLGEGKSISKVLEKLPLFASVGIIRGTIKDLIMPAGLKGVHSIVMDNLVTFVMVIWGAFVRELWSPTRVPGLVPQPVHAKRD